MLLTTVTKANRASSVFLWSLPTDLIRNSRHFHKTLIFFQLAVKPFFTSCSRVVSRRVWRREVHFFWGPAVAPAVLQVFALLRVAGGLRLLPRPRPDSVHRLQQRRLTATNHIRNACTGRRKRHTLLTAAERLRNLEALAHEHCSITHSQCKADTKLSIYRSELAHWSVCKGVLLTLFDDLFFLFILYVSHIKKWK